MSLSIMHNTTGNIGELLVADVVEVLPGDAMRFQHQTVVRTVPLVHPAFQQINLRMENFFVPTRILDKATDAQPFEDLVTGVAGDDATAPTVTIPADNALGNLIGTPNNGASNAVIAYPIRAYNKIWNEFFRDQQLQNEIDLDQTTLQRVNHVKDYFTASRNDAELGDESEIAVSGVDWSQFLYDFTTSTTTRRVLDGSGTTTNDANNALYIRNVGNATDAGPPTAAGGGLTLNALRDLMARQSFKEKRAFHGTRYEDYLRTFGVAPQDSRLQNPIRLPGGSGRVTISEVVQTAEGTTSDVGDLYGHGLGVCMQRRPAMYRAPEFGYHVTLFFARPVQTYGQGLPRFLTRSTTTDFFRPEDELLGPQEVLNREVVANHNSPTGTFSHTARHEEYRSRHNRYSRGMASPDLNWHQGRVLGTDVALNSDFIECNPSDRIFQTNSEDDLKIHHRLNVRMRRPVRR